MLPQPQHPPPHLIKLTAYLFVSLSVCRNFAAQNRLLDFGFVACTGQECQKQPSTNTTSLRTCAKTEVWFSRQFALQAIPQSMPTKPAGVVVPARYPSI